MSDAPTEPAPPEVATPDWPRAWWLLAVVAFGVGFVNFPMQVVGWRLDQLPGDPIDNRLNNFVLEHGYRYLAGKVEYFWDAPSYYPRTGATAWSDAHIGMLPLYAAVRVVGGSPEQAFQWHFLLSCVLNFVAAAWAARRLGFGPVGVAVTGYLFAYALPVVGQTQHTQLIPRFLVPPAAVFAWEFLWFPRTWRLAAVAACGVGTLFISVYIGFLLVLTLATGLFVTLVRFGHALPWRELIACGWRVWVARVLVVVAALVPTKWLVDQHNRGARGGVQPEQIKEMAAIPKSWLTAPKNAYHHPDTKWSLLPDFPMPVGEHLMLPGLVPIAAVAVVALLIVLPTRPRSPRQVAVVAAWASLLLAALVTRYDDFWPYEILTALPGAGGIRVPGRICLLLPLLGGFAIGYLADTSVRLVRRLGVVPAVVVAGVWLAAVALDQRLIPREGHPENRQAWEQFHHTRSVAAAWQREMAEVIRRQPNAKCVYAFLSAPNGPGGPLGLQVIVMRASQDLGIPCVNGWTGYAPPDWGFFPNYRLLMTWLTESNDIPADMLEGLVVVGEPIPDTNPIYEALMRAKHPPQVLRDLGPER